MNNRLFAFASLSLLVACGGADRAPSGEPLAQDEQNFFYSQTKIWTDTSISVCWADAVAQYQRGWIRQAVEREIESLVDVDFTGWGDCGLNGAEVVIDFDEDFMPAASVGRRNSSPSPSVYLNPFFGEPKDLDGKEGVDLAWCYGGGVTQSQNGHTWSSGREYCQETIAVHEFLHVLAVTHEQYRPDRPSYCTLEEDDIPIGDTSYGAWDITSASNYVTPSGWVKVLSAPTTTRA